MRSTGNLDAPLAAISSGELTLGGWIYHNGAVVDVDIITSGAATLTWHSEGDIGLQGLWLLDDVEAASYGQDSSGNGRHATLKSGIIAYPDSPRRHRAIRPARVGLRIKTNAA